MKNLEVRITLNFEYSDIELCPACGADKITVERGSCAKCDYSAGSEFAEQWIAFVDALPEPPHGIKINECHEADGSVSRFWIAVNIYTFDNPTRRAFGKWVEEIGGIVTGRRMI